MPTEQTKSDRSLPDVIDALLALVPDAQPCKPQLKKQLLHIKHGVVYMPPESMYRCWQSVANILTVYTAKIHPRPEWVLRLIAVFNDTQEGE